MWIKHDDTALNVEVVLDASIDKTNMKLISTVEIKDVRIIEAVPLSELFNEVKRIIILEWGPGASTDDLRSELMWKYVFSRALVDDFIEQHGIELSLKNDEGA